MQHQYIKAIIDGAVIPSEDESMIAKMEEISFMDTDLDT